MKMKTKCNQKIFKNDDSMCNEKRVKKYVFCAFKRKDLNFFPSQNQKNRIRLE